MKENSRVRGVRTVTKRLPIAFIIGAVAFLLLYPAFATPPRSSLCFIERLPVSMWSYFPDDVKFLIGWTFDAAALTAPIHPGDIVDANAGFASVRGFAGPTPTTQLRGRYRVLRAPFDDGRGYYGVMLGALGEDGKTVAVLLVNRLFCMPIALRDPIGLATDLLTNVAMAIGVRTPAIEDAESAAHTALRASEQSRVPLVIAGQSQAGAEAQLQIAHILKEAAAARVPVGFLTFNAAVSAASIRRLGVAEMDVPGANFSKDLDPVVGPHALFANQVGLQIYIHPDGSSGTSAADVTVFSALLHPRQHFLDSFNNMLVSPALIEIMKGRSASGCE